MEKYLTPQDYQIAKNNGISEKRAYDRFYKFGWDKDRAITQPVRRKRDMSKWVALAESNGIKSSTFYHRVGARMDWCPRKAATTPVQNHKKPVKNLVSTEDEFFGGA